MKRHLGESRDHFARRAFMQRTGAAIKNHHVRALKVKATVGYTLDDVRNLVRAEIGKPCPYCAERIHTRNFSLDHAQPVSRNGDWALANMKVCCLHCNRMKGALTAVEFMGLMDFLRSLAPEAATDVKRRLSAGGTAMMNWKRASFQRRQQQEASK